MAAAVKSNLMTRYLRFALDRWPQQAVVRYPAADFDWSVTAGLIVLTAGIHQAESDVRGFILRITE
jgi:hypothetical protein